MKQVHRVPMLAGFVTLLLTLVAYGRQPQSVVPESPRVSSAERGLMAPRLLKFGGALKDRTGGALSGIQGVTFALYQEQQGGVPLWQETQNVRVDEQGNYIALLGATKVEGMPVELFTSGESRWLGVQVQVAGEEEQARVLLVSVPYALRAADADTVGGKPASAFMLAPADGQKTSDAQTGVTTNSSGGPATVSPTPMAYPLNVNEDLILAGNLRFQNDQTERFITSSVNGGAIRIRSNSAAATDRSVQLGHVDNAGNWLGANLTAVEGGYVGIGTSTPQAPLEVQLAGSGGPGLLFSVLTPGNTPFLTWKTGDSLNPKYSIRWGGGSNGRFQIGLGDNTGFTEQMSILSNGRVGIGTTNPAAPLDVAGNVNASGTFNGDGSGLTGLNAGNISTGTLPIARGGTGVTSAQGTGSKVQLSNGTITNNNCVKFDASGNTVDAGAICGTISAVNAGAGLTGGAASGSATLAMSAASRTRGIVYLGGCDNCSALVPTTDNQKTIYLNVVGSMTFGSVTCFTDAGSPTVNIQRSGSNVLSSDLTCSTSSSGASSSSFAITTLSQNETLDFVLSSNPSNSAHRVTLAIQTTVN